MKRIKYDQKVQKEIASPTIVDSFTSLLKRARITETIVDIGFTVSLKQLKKTKKFTLGETIYSFCNLAWECQLVQSSSDPKVYDFQLRCLEPTEVYNRNLRSLAGELTLSTPGKTVSVKFSDSPIILLNAICEDVFKKDTLRLTVTLEIDKKSTLHGHQIFFMSTILLPANRGVFDERYWRTNQHFRTYWKDSIGLTEAEMKLPLCDMLTGYFSRLLSESTFRSSYAFEWMIIPNYLVWSLGVSAEENYYYAMAKAGILKLVAKLFAADYSQCSFDTSITVLRQFVNLLIDGFERCIKDPQPGFLSLDSPIHSFSGEICDAFDEAFVNIVAKFSNKRYSYDLLSFFATRALGMFGENRSHAIMMDSMQSAESLASSRMYLKAIENIDSLLPFLDIQVMNVIVRQPGCYKRHLVNFCRFFNALVGFCFNRKNISEETRTKLLKLVCENYTNPFYFLCNTGQPLSFHEVANPYSNFVQDWCKENLHLSPGLVFAATARFGFGTLEGSALLKSREKKMLIDFIRPEHRNFIPLLIASFKSTFGRDLGANLDMAMVRDMNEYGHDMATRDKEIANELHRSGRFEEAVEKYTEIIEHLEDNVSVCRAFYGLVNIWPGSHNYGPYRVIDMMNAVRNNRSASYLELEMYNEALADSCVAINEQQNLINGNHHFSFCIVPSFEIPQLKLRNTKSKLRRIKILVGMKEWVPALHNSMDLMFNVPNCPQHVIDYYYCSLVGYSSTASVLQYPIFCISCQNSEQLIQNLTKFRCESCRHPFCSEECYHKDSRHQTYCSQLTDFCKSKKFTEYHYVDSPC